MRRRPGITLIEVLVAIFIMAIGLLALLTLFPLGALRMSQALQDDRTGSAASEAANLCDSLGIRKDPSFDYVDPPTPGFQPASLSGGGIPVYVDPYGIADGSGAALGGPASYVTMPNPQTPGITRAVPSVFTQVPYALPNGSPPPAFLPQPLAIAARYFTLLDDMSFTPGGGPDVSTGSIPRGGRYTWAYLLHKSQPGAPNSPVDLTIVVYAGRTTAVPSGEATYAAPPDPSGVANLTNSTSIYLQHAGTLPNVRRGTWILDTSYDSPLPGSARPTGAVHGDFYRVVSVTPVDATHVSLELQTPLSKPVTAITVMDSVAEVFLRGTDDSTKWEFR